MHDSLDQELLRAIRRAPGRKLDDLADAVGVPRTNFGRPLGSGVRARVDRLLHEGLVEADGERYHLSHRGRRALAEAALNDPR